MALRCARGGGKTRSDKNMRTMGFLDFWKVVKSRGDQRSLFFFGN